MHKIFLLDFICHENVQVDSFPSRLTMLSLMKMNQTCAMLNLRECGIKWEKSLRNILSQCPSSTNEESWGLRG